MATIFISYRRADSADISGRIYDRLSDRFGRGNVFKDVDSIPAGVNFPDYIAESIEASDVALIIIGPHWLEASAGFAQRRLDDPADFVRVEIETALRLGVTVIPVLVGGARMPAERRLPASLRPLLQQNGLQVRQDPDFSRDMDRVCAAIEYWQRQPRRAPVSAPEPPAPVIIPDVVATPIAAEPAPRTPASIETVARQPDVATAIAEHSDAVPTRAHKLNRPLAPILIAIAALLVIAVSVSMLFTGAWQRLLNTPDIQATQTARAMATLGREVEATQTAQARLVESEYKPLGIGPCADKTEIYNVRDYPYYWDTRDPAFASCSTDKRIVTLSQNDTHSGGVIYYGRRADTGSRFPPTFTASFTVDFVNGASPACADVSALFTGDSEQVPAPTGRFIAICGDGTWRDIWDNSSSWRNFAPPNTTAHVSIYVSKSDVIFTVNGMQLAKSSGNTIQFDQISISPSSKIYSDSISIKVSDFTIEPNS